MTTSSDTTLRYTSFHRDLSLLFQQQKEEEVVERIEEEESMEYLTPPEQALLLQIRRRKAHLLREITLLQSEIDVVTKSLTDSSSTTTKTPPLASFEETTPSSETAEEVQLQIHQKTMSLGCKKFNMDPKKGIEFLMEGGVIVKRVDGGDDVGAAVRSVSQFLYRGEGLNKTAIGDYLGEKNDFNERVLKAFVELHDFTDLLLVQALRQFLWSFRLPGEAQKIDRMMESFAQRYCHCNPDIFTNTDTCYVLSFAIIMLNTSLHNPSVKQKPTPDQFIAMNRGINNGGDLPKELLTQLYSSIQAEPFKIPEDDGQDLNLLFFNSQKEGWLWKQGGRYKTWKRRWFILNDNCLYYFEFTTDKEPRGIIPLENVSIRYSTQQNSSDKNKFAFEIYSKSGEVIKACKTADGRVIEGKHVVYRLCSGSEDERREWVMRIGSAIVCRGF